MERARKASLFFCSISAVVIVSFLLIASETIASDISFSNVVEMTNASRMEKSKTPLETSEKLSRAAMAKADDMINKNYFSHTSPEGKTPWHWIEKSEYDYNYAGENLAMDFQSATKMQEAWMKSPTHRSNILSDRYKEIGVAVKSGEIDGKQTTLVVVMFGSGDKSLSRENETQTKAIQGSKKSVEKLEINLPSLPKGEERKKPLSFENPIITSPQAGEVLSDRSMDIFGRAQPGIEVEIFDNGLFLEKTFANDEGWFIVKGKAISPGEHQLAVRYKKKMLSRDITFFVDQDKPNLDYKLSVLPDKPDWYFVEVKPTEDNCEIEFLGEKRYITSLNQSTSFTFKTSVSSSVFWIKDAAGNRNFRQVVFSGLRTDEENDFSPEDMIADLMAVKKVYAAEKDREILMKNMGLDN